MKSKTRRYLLLHTIVWNLKVAHSQRPSYWNRGEEASIGGGEFEQPAYYLVPQSRCHLKPPTVNIYLATVTRVSPGLTFRNSFRVLVGLKKCCPCFFLQ